MRYIWHIRWVVPVLFLLFIAWQSLVATYSLQALTDFKQRTAWFEVLLPAGRVTKTDSGLVLKSEPVYVDVRLPLRAAAVTLELSTTAASVPVKLGVRQGSGFQYDYSATEEFRGDTRTFRLRATNWPYLEPGHRLRFILSVPGLKPGNVVVTGAKVTVERRPFSWDWVKRAFSSL